MVPLVANHESGQQEAYDAAVTEMLVNAYGWLGSPRESAGFSAQIAGRPSVGPPELPAKVAGVREPPAQGDRLECVSALHDIAPRSRDARGPHY
jgi:hypothetical protein